MAMSLYWNVGKSVAWMCICQSDIAIQPYSHTKYSDVNVLLHRIWFGCHFVFAKHLALSYLVWSEEAARHQW